MNTILLVYSWVLHVHQVTTCTSTRFWQHLCTFQHSRTSFDLNLEECEGISHILVQTKRKCTPLERIQWRWYKSTYNCSNIQILNVHPFTVWNFCYTNNSNNCILIKNIFLFISSYQNTNIKNNISLVYYINYILWTLRTRKGQHV